MILGFGIPVLSLYTLLTFVIIYLLLSMII